DGAGRRSGRYGGGVRAGGGGGEGGATRGADRAARPRGALDARHRYGLPRMRLPRVYPIVDSAAWVRRLAPLGVQLVQLRIKEQPRDGLLEEIREAKACCTSSGMQLVINDYWELALAAGCDFVHLGQGDLEGADVPGLRRAGVRLGISTHDEAELARALGFEPDYVALGPIYPTLLKAMPWAPQGLARISEWKRRIGAIPLVAIGGLTVERLPGVFAAGADSAAVVTDIVRHLDPEARTREWLSVAAAAAALGEETGVSDRYARQSVLPEVGPAGQARLASATALVVGAGGLGCAGLQ